jgi:hypothetical protein
MDWISVTDRMPEPGTDCLVWTHPSWSKRPLAAVDRWDEQHESPVGWSSATIPVGLGWDSCNFEDVSHWMPITPPAVSDLTDEDMADCGLLSEMFPKEQP